MPEQQPLRVLITGFGPFPGAPCNPSRALVERLARMRRPGLRDVRIASHIFATRYAAIDRDFRALITAHDPDIILMFGLAVRTRHIRIETRARNLMSFFPDAGGFVPTTRTIAAGADHRRLAPSLAVRLRLAGRSQGLKTEYSRDAGRYVCNYAFWRALEMNSGNENRLAAFIHIPNLRRASAKTGRSRHPLPGLNILTQTAGAILLTLVASYKRDRRAQS
jgi:pyroglutamyl-peptidase